MKGKMFMTAIEIAKAVAKVLDEKKAEDIQVIETTEHTIISDYFVVASGTSSTHVKALADEVEFQMTKLGFEPLHIEGRATGWILLDYNEVLVHIFTKENREFYNLERLWSDAKTLDISDIVTE